MIHNEKDILKCAKQQGFHIPLLIQVPKTVMEKGKLPYTKKVWRLTKKSDLIIHRGINEYIVSYTQSLTHFRVPYETLRNKILEDILYK